MSLMKSALCAGDNVDGRSSEGDGVGNEVNELGESEHVTIVVIVIISLLHCD